MSSSTAARKAAVLLLAVAVAGLVTGCFKRGRRFAAPPAVPPAGSIVVTPVEECPVDYPTFRRGYRTQLLQTGPSPQSWQPVPVPAGVKEINYESDGRTLPAWVNAEAFNAKVKLPAILWLHGGYAFAREDWDQTRALRNAGYHVLVPVLRGENGQPGSFTLFADEVDDALAAADALAGLPGVDPENLFVAGHEAGGTLALLAAAATDRFRAAATVSAILDCRRAIASRTAPPPFDPNNPDEITLRSPLAFAAHLRCPVRVYFGSGEVVSVEEDTRRLVERARAAGVDAESIRVAGGLLTCVVPATEQAVQFFDQQTRERAP